jgi:GntR family transcriptional regulator/MocR family aminotransferase
MARRVAAGGIAAFMEKACSRGTSARCGANTRRGDRIVRTGARFRALARAGRVRDGMHVCTTLRSETCATEGEIAARARAAGVELDRLSTYYRDPDRAGFVFGYGAIPLSKIDEGLRRLRSCLAR